MPMNASLFYDQNLLGIIVRRFSFIWQWVIVMNDHGLLKIAFLEFLTKMVKMELRYDFLRPYGDYFSKLI